MFDSIVLSTGGPEFYKKAFNDLDEESLKSDTMKKSFDNLATIIKYVDPNFSGRDWNLATAMVIKGDALVQVMGDWAKGEFVAAKKTPDTDFLCYRFPGTDGSVVYNSDMFGMFNVPDDRKAAQVALATATLSKSFQSAFNVVKGSVLSSYRCSRYRLRRLRQEGHRRPEGSQRRRHAVRLAGARLRRTAGDRQCL